MSCPDWRALAQERDDSAETEPAGWSDAVSHFDSGCAHCRRDALAAEPTLIFRRLRTGSPSMSQAQEVSEVDAVRQAVAAMRTASRVDALESRSHSWKRWAVAACLAVAALSISADNSHRVWHVREQAALASQAPSRPAFPLRAATAANAANIVPAALADDAEPPTVEGINRPGARLYHMDGEGMSVVMIVDESFDV